MESLEGINLVDIIYEELKKGSNDLKIVIPKDTYYIRDIKAIKEFERLLNGKLSPDIPWGAKNIPYNMAFELKGLKRVEIDGQNSKLIFSGLIQPFEIINCENLTLKNFSIDWERPPYSEGKIKEVLEESVIVEIFDEYTLFGGEPVWSFHNYNIQNRRFGEICPYRDMSNLRHISNNIFEFKYKDAKKLFAGEGIVIRHIGNYRPGIYIHESKNVKIENVQIKCCVGMGILAFKSENINIINSSVEPAVDRQMSSTTDATHFISCKGRILFNNCYFSGMGDDVANVHGFYYMIQEIVDAKTVIVNIDSEFGTQNQIMDYPDISDKIEFVKKESLKTFAQNKVKRVIRHQNEMSLIIEFEYDIVNEIKKGDLLANSTRTGKLFFNQCRVENIRARGLLIQSRDCLVTNSTFQYCTGTGIHINTASGWWESIGTQNIAIINNLFEHCGYGPGTYKDTSGICIQTECEEPAKGVHRDIIIANNKIIASKNTGIHIESADGVTLANNNISSCKVPVVISLSRNVYHI